MSDNSPKDQTLNKGQFLKLFLAHEHIFYSFILASVHNYSDAEDILQDTATLMWGRFDEFRQGTNFKAWGLTIARYRILNYFRSHSRSRIQFDSELLNQLTDLTLEEMSQSATIQDAFQQCLNKLSDTNRKLLKYRYKDGLTIKDISITLGKSLHSMYKTFARIQDALQNCIGKTINWEETA